MNLLSIIAGSMFFIVLLAGTAYTMYRSHQMVKKTGPRRITEMGVGLMYDPPHPGAVLNEDFLKPLGLSVRIAAKKLSVKYQTLRYIVKGKKGISPILAAKLSRMLGTSPQLWLNMQNMYDLWHVMESEKENLRNIERISSPLE